MLALVAGAAGCGEPKPGANEARFPEAKRPVARTVDRLQAAARDGDGERICDELLTERLAERLGDCERVVKAQLVADDAKLTVDSIRVRGRVAYASVRERNGNVSRVRLRRSGEGWRVDAIQAQRSRRSR